MIQHSGSGNIRIDRWLWVARFFKTRSLAARAVSGGRVHVNGGRIKPARLVKLGDELRISRGDLECVVCIVKLSNRRGPASEAQKLYTETAESLASREKWQEERQLKRAAEMIYGPAKRPDKRQRRRLIKFTRQRS